MEIRPVSEADRAVLERWIIRRDAEAFRALVQRYSDMVFATCRRILGNASEAEDVAQECFEALAQVESAPRARSLGPWLHGVATKRSLQHLRSDKRRKEREKRFADSRERRTEVQWDDIYAYVDQAIMELPERLRAPLIAHFFEGQSHVVIAERMEASRQVVTYRIAKGIQGIRKSLRRQGIRVAASALAVMIGMNCAEPAPATLKATLGKLALAGREGAVPADTTITGGRTSLLPGPVAMKVLAVCGATAVIGTVAFLARPPAPVAPMSVPRPVLAMTEEPPAPVDKPHPLAEPPERVAPDSEVAPTDVEPAEFASVSGVVTDEEKRPIGGAEVLLVRVAQETDQPGAAQLWPWSIGWHQPNYVQVARLLQTESDDQGRFTIDNIPFDGEAIVAAGKQGYAGSKVLAPLEQGRVSSVDDLVLLPGSALGGRVLAPHGAHVTDAVVFVAEAWHAEDFTRGSPRGWGATITDRAGRFTLGLDPEAQWCTLLVYSASHGSACFIRHAVSEGHTELKMPRPATLRGTVTYSDGRPAEDLTIYLAGRLPEADIRVMHRVIVTATDGLQPLGGTDAQGHYTIPSIAPGVRYRAQIALPDPEAPSDYQKANPLTPRDEPFRFTPAPGEEVVWDCTVSGVVTIRGRVLTERTGQPVRCAAVHVVKDGQPLGRWKTSDEDGYYEYHLGTGAGLYLLYATPASSVNWMERDADNEFARRFGRELRLNGGEEVEVDLKLYEPVVLPIRVLDAQRKPVREADLTVTVIDLGGEKHGSSGRHTLDENGRKEMLIHAAVADLWIGVAPIPEGPRIETRHFTAQPGAVLPEETVVLEPGCGVTGRILNPDGSPLANTVIRVEADYADEQRSHLEFSTDGQGIIKARMILRANRRVALRVYLSDPNTAWVFETVKCPPDGTIDLGEFTLPPPA